MIPSTNDLEDAVVEILSRFPDGLTVDELRDKVMEYFALPREAKFMRGNNGRSELSYRLGWARTHAKNHGRIEKAGTARWRIISK